MSLNKIVDRVVYRLLFWVCVLITIQIAINFGASYFKIGFDDTDGEYRSGMGILTDNRTSCQYLYTPDGGLTPRLDRDGRHICERPEL